MKKFGALFFSILLAVSGRSQSLKLPPRATNAMSGSEFAKAIELLDSKEREERIYQQVAAGNVPDFLRKLAPVRVQAVMDDKTNSATYYVTPDYLAVGSDADYFLTPLSPIMAQKVADLLRCNLPTRKMVDDIYRAAAVKLAPSPIPPGPTMVTVPVFVQHNATVWQQRKAQLAAHPLGTLVAGDKKDVVIAAKLPAGKVAIYGWHKLDGTAIQPLYMGHADFYADYSHGIRLVMQTIGVNGASVNLTEVLADTKLCGLLSDEGPVSVSGYASAFKRGPTPNFGTPVNGTNISAPNLIGSTATAGGSNASPPIKTVALMDFKPGPFEEQVITYNVDPEVRVHINAPAKFNDSKKVKLIFYGLPNGNTIEQTIGRSLKASGDNWHFNIQHIGAQTRFLRQVLSNDCSVVVVYLEAGKKSWPAWRKEHADLRGFIPSLVDSVKSTFKDYNVRITLSGHSGGGSLIFGYINGVDKIPDTVERIAFLDSNYAYESAQGHTGKLMDWLKSSDQHYLSVLAYNDAVALLNGTNFVSANGGTWGRSHAMLKDMDGLNFSSDTNSNPQVLTALGGRVKFLLKENPEKKIYHTVQVEKNGFIQSMLSGTRYEGKGYEYFGDAAYTKWIQDE